MSPNRWFAQHAWVAALIVALALTLCDAVSRIRRVESVSGIRGQMVETPTADAASSTGYALGAELILPDVGEDGYQWIIQTQTMLANGDWRVRHADYDNAPAGREVHWASPLRWWLATLAWVDHAASGRPLGAAVEWAALRANPLLLVLLLAGLIPLVARRFGSVAAAVLALGLWTAFPFNVCFGADNPDHHGIINTCVMLTVLFLLAGGGGLVRTGDQTAGSDGTRCLPDFRMARRWFVASAVAGGVGLWVSAVSEVPVLIGVGLGAAWSGWIGRGEPADAVWRRDPTLWRWWGWIGGGVSLAAYLVEYFPSHLGFRLEVNHPLYAIAWCGGGELLCRFFRMCGPEGIKFERRDVRASVLAVAAVALVPVVILLTKEQTFLVGDRFIWLLNTEFVSEGKSLVRFIAPKLSRPLALGLMLPLLLIVPPLWFLCRRDGERFLKAQMTLALVPALLFLLLTLREIRWWGPALGLLFAALAPVFAALEREKSSRRALWWTAVACGLVLLPGTTAMVQAMMQPPGPGPADIRRLAERDVAHWLRQRMGADRTVVASTPVTTNHLIYHGNCLGLGTLYWENTEGFKHAAAIFSASTAEEARELVSRFGVTHIVLLTWDEFAENFVRFYRELPMDQAVPVDTFIQFLRRGGVPPWLRLIPCRLPPAEGLNGQVVLVFEVTAEQSPADAAARLMYYLLEMDNTGPAAMAVMKQLEQFPADLRAQVMLACYEGRTGQADAFATTFGRVQLNLPQSVNLAVEDRIRLALVLAAGKESDLAREQIRRVLTDLDERTLRRLSFGPLRDLLKLTEALGVDFPDTRLRQFAISLCGPMPRP